MDDIRNSEHPSKHRFLAVPKRSGDHTWEKSALGHGVALYVPTIEEKALEGFLDL